MRDTTAGLPAGSAPVAEDLRTLAPEAFRLALERCHDHCRNYHATWQYKRLAGTLGSVDTDRRALVDLIRAAHARRPLRRVAIGGAVDSGTTGICAEALGVDGAGTLVTVLDLCPTPLALCELAARDWPLRVATRVGDLRAVAPDEPQDLLLLHSLLRHLPVEEHRPLLERLRGWLRPGGTLLLSMRLDTPGHDRGERIGRRRGDDVLAGLRDRAVPLPEPEDRFLDRLVAEHQRARPGLAPADEPPDGLRYARLAEEAGFTLRYRVLVPPGPGAGAIYRERGRIVVVAEAA